MPLSRTLVRQLRQTATYWAPSSVNAYGTVTFATPATISVRWENIGELYIDSNGDEARGRAVIFSLTSMALGGYLYLGTSVAADPESVVGADQIRSIEGVPSIQADLTLYKAIL